MRKSKPSEVWGADVPELLHRSPRVRYAVTARPDRAPIGARRRKLYGWVEIPANHRIIDPDGTPRLLDAKDAVVAVLDGVLVEAHADRKEARVAC
jgi:hypothetical protein